MTAFRLEIRITPRPGLLNPEGNAVHHALQSLGYETVTDVRAGKTFYVTLEAADEDAATSVAEDMSRRLLANPVTEDFTITVAALDGAGVPG